MAAEDVVYVVDDDDAFRDSLSFLFSAHDMAVRTYESATEFLEVAGNALQGCVVTDVRMPGMSGIELLQELKAQGSTLPVIVMTGHGDVPMAVEAMKHGAIDFIEKPFDDGELLDAVAAALKIRRKGIASNGDRAAIAERIEALSGRERDVLNGLIDGKPNKSIARDLGISPRTVEVYRANLMAKMRARSLSDLVRMTLIAGV